MTIRFDTLSFAKRLTQAGEKPEIAEAHALAFKEFVMDHLATKDDLLLTKEDLRREIGDVRTGLRGEIATLGRELRGEIATLGQELRGEIALLRKETYSSIDLLRKDTNSSIDLLRKDTNSGIDLLRKDTNSGIDLLRKDMEAMGLKLTVRMGGMLAVAVGTVATLNKIF